MTSDQPSPLLMVGQDGGGHCYAIRLTPCSKFSDIHVRDWLASADDPWILSKETSRDGVEHYHILLWTDLTIDPMRTELREFLETFWSKDERKRGFGNKQYNLQSVTDLYAYATYLSKEQCIQYSVNVNPRFIDYCKKKSYTKFSKETFAKEFDRIRDQYKMGIYNIQWFMDRYVDLKGKYRQPYKVNYAFELAISHEFHNHPYKGHDYNRLFLEDKLKYINL